MTTVPTASLASLDRSDALWILLGGLVVGLLVLGLAARPVLRRLPALNRAVRRAQALADDAQQLQERAETLATQAEALGTGAAAMQQRLLPLAGRLKQARGAAR